VHNGGTSINTSMYPSMPSCVQERGKEPWNLGRECDCNLKLLRFLLPRSFELFFSFSLSQSTVHYISGQSIGSLLACISVAYLILHNSNSQVLIVTGVTVRSNNGWVTVLRSNNPDLAPRVVCTGQGVYNAHLGRSARVSSFVYPPHRSIGRDGL
jgi:hypothetical protein